MGIRFPMRIGYAVVLKQGIACTLFIGLVAVGATPIGGQEPDGGMEGSGALPCAEGVITSIDLDRRTVFDPDSTGVRFLAWTYEVLNALHIRTQSSFIRRELLFDVGDCYDDFLVSESERLLDSYGFLESARITAEGDGSAGRRLRVWTRDDWSTQVDLGVTYDDQLNLEKFEVTEENFLGQGIRAEFTHRERREVRAQSVRMATPRLFGRTDASIEFGRDRPGTFFKEYVRYPFIGETGRYSLRQGYDRGTSFYAYARPEGEEVRQVVVPAFREVIEFSAARRFGELGRSVIAGLTLSRDVNRFRPPEAVVSGDIDDQRPLFPVDSISRLASQLDERGATRVWLHVGARRFRYVEYRGLDALRDQQLVGLGYTMGVSFGTGLNVLIPDEVSGVNDFFGRANAAFTLPAGSSLFHGAASVESRHEQREWRDVLAHAELVAYLRNDAVRAHTIFLRTSLAGGWRTTIPFQLSLGGREGVRSLPEDRHPGGRMVRFVIEDRILLPWPQRTADLGLTVFADVGRVLPGDAPYGIDSGWQTALGGGLRIGLPARTRHVWRADVAFPVGRTDAGPLFRLTFELNRMSRGFFTPDFVRSRRFDLGAHHF